MPVRHVLLGAFAVAVLGLAVYLFFEVRASPAAPQARVAKVDKADKDDKDDKDEKATPEPAPKPPRTTERDSRSGRGSGILSRANRKAASSEQPAPETPTAPPDGTVAVKLDALMSEANKAYDRQDFDEAKTIAQKVLKQSPNNSRMLRIMVSTACVGNDAAEAQKHYNLLTSASDREQMKTRCLRDFGITLAETKK